MSESIRQELLERYESTGRVGLIKPSSREEALKLIETVVELYDEEPEEETFTLKEVADRLRNFLSNF